MNRKSLVLGLASSLVIILVSVIGCAGAVPSGQPLAVSLVTGLEGATGSTIGPDRALYVTEGVAGRISRVDPRTGQVTTFASGLPQASVNIGGADIGGPIDIAFIRKTAYVLVTLVGSDIGGQDTVGIYRVDGPDNFTVVADIGAFSENHLPDYEVQVPTGLQYALEPYGGGFLVTDGHHNRVLRVTLDGEVSELIAFDNIVPAGMAVRRKRVYMAEAGPVPHLSQDGKVVEFRPQSPTATEVASGAPLVVDVELGRGGKLYALSQGEFAEGSDPATPAMPGTGALVKVNKDGTFTVIADGLDRPTSLEFIRNTAYVVTLAGEIVKIDGASR